MENNSEELLMKPKEPSPGGLEPQVFRLTAERTNRLRHGDLYKKRCTDFILWMKF